MIKQIAVSSHYLPADACEFIGETLRRFPVITSVAVLALLGATVAILRRRFGRMDSDLFAIALFFVGFTIFTAACLYLLTTHAGYHIYHPGF